MASPKDTKGPIVKTGLTAGQTGVETKKVNGEVSFIKKI